MTYKGTTPQYAGGPVHVSDPVLSVVVRAGERVRLRRDAAEMAGLTELAEELTRQLIEMATLAHTLARDHAVPDLGAHS